MSTSLKVDIAIVGAGIAGLWTLNRLKLAGYNAVLLESNDIGAGQTIGSQGIIHGGLKYALTGHLNNAANAIQNMPSLWKACLQGTGELDLSSVKVLSQAQYLWSTGSIATNISNFFASKALKSRVKSLRRSMFPTIFQHRNFKGRVYQLEEQVLDIPSLLKSLFQPFHKSIIKLDPEQGCQPIYSDDGKMQSLDLRIDGKPLNLTAQKFIFTAGEQNEQLVKGLSNSPKMQRRPLQMLILKAKQLPPLFGHCIGLGSTPRLTITTHQTIDGTPVWYIGGTIAEQIDRAPNEQIKFAKKEIETLFPWLDLTGASWSSFMINRAEAKQANQKKPDTPSIIQHYDAIVAWPTKLAFAPVLASEIIQLLEQQSIVPEHPANLNEFSFPQPDLAKTHWDEM